MKRLIILILLLSAGIVYGQVARPTNLSVGGVADFARYFNHVASGSGALPAVASSGIQYVDWTVPTEPRLYISNGSDWVSQSPLTSEIVASLSLKMNVDGSNASDEVSLPGTLNVASGVSTQYLDLDTASTTNPAYKYGRFFWDKDDDTPALYTAVPEFVHQIGQELVVRAKNDQGAPILDGQVVYISSSTVGIHPMARLAQANSTSTADVIGVATHNIGTNQFGHFTILGIVRGIDTSGFEGGCCLYLSNTTPGSWTCTVPVADEINVEVGHVVMVHATEGSIYVRPRVNGSLVPAYFASDVVVEGTLKDGSDSEYSLKSYVNDLGASLTEKISIIEEQLIEGGLKYYYTKTETVAGTRDLSLTSPAIATEAVSFVVDGLTPATYTVQHISPIVGVATISGEIAYSRYFSSDQAISTGRIVGYIQELWTVDSDGLSNPTFIATGSSCSIIGTTKGLCTGKFNLLVDTSMGGATPVTRRLMLIHYFYRTGTTGGTDPTITAWCGGQYSGAISLQLPSAVVMKTDGTNSDIDYLNFAANSAFPAYQKGRVFWDNSDMALAVYGESADSILQLGQECYVRAFNNTGAPIPNASVVVINAAIAGVIPTAVLAQANASATAHVIGVSTHEVAVGAYGYFTTHGVLRGVDTTAFSAGADLYLSATTAGSFTTTVPAAPNMVVIVGRVLASTVSGAIFVRPEVCGSMERAQFAAGAHVTGNASISANLDVGGIASIGGALTVAGNIGAGTVQGASQVASSAYVDAAIAAIPSFWAADDQGTYLASNAEEIEMRDSGLAHGMTALADTDAFLHLKENDSNRGGLTFNTLAGDSLTGDDVVLLLRSVSVDTAPSVYSQVFEIGRKATTTWSGYLGTVPGWCWRNGVSEAMTLNSDGDLVVTNASISENLNVAGNIIPLGTVDSVDVSAASGAIDLHVAATTGVHGAPANTRFFTASETLGIANGGTGATSEAAARTNLDVYSKTEVDAVSWMQYLGIVDLSATYTLTIDDRSKLLRMSVASTDVDLAQSVILPASDSVALTPGSMIHFQRAGVGEVPIIGASGVTVQSTASPTAEPWLLMQHSVATAIYLGSDTYLVTGHLKDKPQ